MIIRKAHAKDSTAISFHILLAMDEILYHFIGENSTEKATQFLINLISKEANQYSYENCWVAEIENEIAATAIVYDGAKLLDLREQVAKEIKIMFGRDFNPENETQAGEYYVDCLAVSPYQQGKGIGSKLLHFLIDEYVYKRNEPLGLLVDKDNPDAKKLYLKLGFESVGETTLAGKELEHLQFKTN